MTLGAGTFYPSAKYSMPRSYVFGVWLSFDAGSSVVWSGNEVSFVDPSGTVSGKISLLPEFFAWNSNVYTLDFLIIESWYSVAPSPTEIPLPFSLQPYRDPLDGKPYIVYAPFGITGSSAFKHALPPAPPSYWRPQWL